MRRVKELKEENDVTQDELAFVLGVTQQRISKLLSGKSKFYPEEIKRCANYFEVTSDYLLELSDDRRAVKIDVTVINEISESHRRSLLYFFGLISEKQRRVVLELLKSMAESNM